MSKESKKLFNAVKLNLKPITKFGDISQSNEKQRVFIDVKTGVKYAASYKQEK